MYQNARVGRVERAAVIAFTHQICGIVCSRCRCVALAITKVSSFCFRELLECRHFDCVRGRFRGMKPHIFRDKVPRVS